MQYIAITGHRPAKLDYDYELSGPLCIMIRERIHEFIEREFVKGNVTFITGMALGIDTLFARMAITLGIPFIAAIPCHGHDSKWPERSKSIYRYILSHPLCTVQLVSDTPYSDAVMQKRNEWMVDRCNHLIAVWDGTSGGTKNCLDYAKKQISAVGNSRVSKIKGIYYIDPNILRKQLQTKPYNS